MLRFFFCCVFSFFLFPFKVDYDLDAIDIISDAPKALADAELINRDSEDHIMEYAMEYETSRSVI